jgi:AcrR family transcriptional regulator
MRYLLRMARTDRLPRQRLGEGPRRAAIVRAATSAFSDASYEQVTVAQVALAAAASEALVHRYFGSKSGLYLAAVQVAIDQLLDRQRRADGALGPAASARARLAASIRVYLDFVSERAMGWAGPLRSPSTEPAEATALRQRTREKYLRLLRDMLDLPPEPHLDYALHGYLGFLDTASLAWVEAGCPDQAREPLVAQALAALSGALAAMGQHLPP